MQLECKHHGLTYHRLSSVGKKRGKKHVCTKCIMARQTRVRHRKKQALLDSLGGQCVLCGYKRWAFAIDFHHVNPSDKEFELGSGGFRSLAACLTEAKKCVLLCRNCHSEFETGYAETVASLAQYLKSCGT